MSNRTIVNHQWVCPSCKTTIGEDYITCSICDYEELYNERPGPEQKLSEKRGEEEMLEDEELIIRNFNFLTPNQKRILPVRYGWKDGQFKNLAETGRLLGIGREAVRSAERNALVKIRNKLAKRK